MATPCFEPKYCQDLWCPPNTEDIDESQFTFNKQDLNVHKDEMIEGFEQYF